MELLELVLTLADAVFDGDMTKEEAFDALLRERNITKESLDAFKKEMKKALGCEMVRAEKFIKKSK